MYRLLLLLIVSALLSPAPAGTYKWVDDEGRTHYSDQPRKGDGNSGKGEADLPEISTVEPNRGPVNRGRQESESGATDVAYQLVRVVRPDEGQLIWLEGEPVRFAAAANPSLKSSHRVRFILNGEPVNDEPIRGLSLELDTLPPGNHSIRVRIVTADGGQVIESDPVTFKVRRPE